MWMLLQQTLDGTGPGSAGGPGAAPLFGGGLGAGGASQGEQDSLGAAGPGGGSATRGPGTSGAGGGPGTSSGGGLGSGAVPTMPGGGQAGSVRGRRRASGGHGARGAGPGGDAEEGTSRYWTPEEHWRFLKAIEMWVLPVAHPSRARGQPEG